MDALQYLNRSSCFTSQISLVPLAWALTVLPSQPVRLCLIIYYSYQISQLVVCILI